jgi:plastocyanin
MSTTRIRNLALAFAIPALLIVAVAVWAIGAGADPGEREIVLYARGMAFFEPGSAAPNPMLRVTAGESVRFTVINDDPGVRHDLAVESLGLAIAPLAATPGSRGTASLRVPARPGRYPYVCTFHAQMMRGVVEVVPGG